MNKFFFKSQHLAPSMKEGVFFLLFILIFISCAAQNRLFQLKLKLNDSINLQLPVILDNHQLAIPAYSNAIKYTSKFEIKNDSLITSISVYENKLLLKKITKELYAGKWIKYSGNKYYTLNCTLQSIVKLTIPDTLKMNLFPKRWKIQMISDTKTYYAIGIFQYNNQENTSYLSGSIATPYGDLGHLNGHIQNDSLYLSVFNGAFATQLIGKLKYSSTSVDTIIGWIYYGDWGVEKFIATPDETFSLDNEVNINEIFGNATFALNHLWKDIDNQPIILQKNKPVILLIMGSWCPNCTDQNKLFTEWYPRIFNKVQIIALSVERTQDVSKANALLKKYKQKLNIPYPIVLLSANANKLPFNIFPEIIKIPAFPTTIYFDKNHKPYTATVGFNGPATNELYYQTQAHIQKILEKIIQ